MRLLDEISQHFLRDREVRNDSIFHRTYRDDVSRRAAKHVLGLLTYGFNLVRHLIDGDDGWFVNDNPATFGIDKSIRSTQINRQVAGKQAEQRAEIHGSFWAPYSLSRRC